MTRGKAGLHPERDPYGHQYQLLRKSMKANMIDGTPCPRCGLGMFRTQRLDLGHVRSIAISGAPQRISRKDVRLEHSSCNRSAGSKLGNALRKGKCARDIHGDHKSEDW
ncbi:hypothetical protein [Rhodococcus qingshengii]|uniref:hypothetical protein n=1 Tax=Rhodococcus qingshengii TaxID=334542 RepID=UPI000815AACC|nr:hypothetical protein [Rhodococcus qingshengii]SCC37562.1 hypothetical protein GA0061093_107161 [Rhodococcus qingshengii]